MMTDDTKTIILCKSCGWKSNELSRTEFRALGVPWYCDDCGQRVERFIRFEPHERDAAFRIAENDAQFYQRRK
jgi:predicted RNA-binding Zn-ribbon protein involved in translation (DUF1610 family)